MTTTVPAATPSESTSTMTLYGGVATRTTLVYAVGMAAVVPTGIISVAVTTRYLSPTDFGRLAVLFAIAAMISVLGSLGFLQGTMMTAYGISDEEADVDDVDDTHEREVPTEHLVAERRRIMGSGTLIVAIYSALVAGIVTAFAAPIASLALGDAKWADAVRWMALSAWSGTVWRMTHQTFRMERRPVMWTVFQWVRPLLVVAASVVVLIQGGGIESVLAATAFATLASVAASILFARRSYLLRPRRGDARLLWDKGKRWVPLNIVVAIQGSVSVLIMAAIAPAAAVGIYQVAQRMAGIPKFFAHGFLMGWAPLERDPISLAAKNRKGRREFEASVFTLYGLSTIGVIVFVAISGDILVQAAAPAYHSSAALIPVLGVACAAEFTFRGVYRATSFSNRRYWFTLLHFLWLVPYAGAIALLSPMSSTYGVAAAEAVAWAIVAVGFVVLDRRAKEPTPFAWLRLALTLVLGAIPVVVVQVFDIGLLGDFAVAVTLLLLAAFGLHRTGVIAPSQRSVVRQVLRLAFPKRIPRREVDARLAAVGPRERDVLIRLDRGTRDVTGVADAIGVSREVAYARLARGLRQFVGREGAGPDDILIGEYVLRADPVIARNVVAARLNEHGVDPLELHLFDAALRAITRDNRHRGGPVQAP